MKSIPEMRAAHCLEAAIVFACHSVHKSRCDLLPEDFEVARQRAIKLNERALVQPLERLSTLGTLVDAMRNGTIPATDDAPR